MNQGQLLDSISRSISLFKDCGFVSNYNKDIVLPSDLPSQLRGLGYEQEWEQILANNWYHIQLDDCSLLQFSKSNYRYFMVPFESLSLDGFFESFFPDPEYKEDPDLFSAVYTEYLQYIESSSVRKPVTPVRFDIDYHEERYCPISHPACHIHIGLENESRIPVKRELSPLAFSAFIVRTFYPKVWKEYIESGQHVKKLPMFKDNLAIVGRDNWEDIEEQLLYIG